jgi:excinuclease ABC subunit C
LINDKIKALPDLPGVYQYFDKNDKIIYVGKAKNLKKRVSSYFTKSNLDRKTKVLVKQINDVKYIVVNSELEALLLENSLIKEHQPRYNVLLKDDKTYPWICIKNEPFPRVFYTRRIVKDGSQYFGPYPSVKMMQTILEIICELYPLRTCNLNLSPSNIEQKKYKVCLEYHIGNCKAPCVGLQNEEEYNEYIENIKHLLKGHVYVLKQELKKKMLEFAESLAFEKAQELKEKIDNLNRYESKFTVVSPTINNLDVASIIRKDNVAYVNVLRVMNGAVVQGHTVELKPKLNESDEELLLYGLIDLRNKFGSDSKEIVVPFKVKTKLEQLKFTVPKRGDKKHLLELSVRNAKALIAEKKKQALLKNPKTKSQRVLEQLQKDLRMPDLPVHIECFDNSNFQGSNAVAACVVFKNAKPSKKDYRHFNIKTVEGPNDFASMEEIVFRRYNRMLEEKQKLPQLIIIDGGKGQLSSALKSIERLGLRGKITVVGIAKKLEEIYFPDDSVPLYLDKRSESLKLIQYLRNEAHRFGITHHRNKRSKNLISSELDNIKGIGEKSKQKLFQHFKSIKNIKQANLNQLCNVLDKSKAKLVFNYFHMK